MMRPVARAGTDGSAALLLSTHERWYLAAAIATIVLPARAAIPLACHLLGMPVSVDPAIFGALYLAIVLGFLPLIIDGVQRTVGRPFRERVAAQLILLVLSAALVPCVVMLVFYTRSKAEFDGVAWLHSIEANAQTGILLYITAAALVRALQWYRSAASIESERIAVAAEAMLATRRVVEQTLRPATVAEVLGRAAQMLRRDAAGAERLVRRLARHGRRAQDILKGAAFTIEVQLRGIASLFLLHGLSCSVEVEPSATRAGSEALEELGDAVERLLSRTVVGSAALTARVQGGRFLVRLKIESDDSREWLAKLRGELAAAGVRVEERLTGEIEIEVPPEKNRVAQRPPQVKLIGSLYVWLVAYLAFAVICYVATSDHERDPFSGGMPLVTAFLWPVIAPVLTGVVTRAVAFSRLGAAASVITAVWVSGLAVSLTAIAIVDHMHASVIGGKRDLVGALLPYAFTRHVLIGASIAAVSYAFAAGRRQLAANAAKERLQAELASEELRGLEATIHPHFLFNALTSLLALIRIDAPRAIVMCDRLRALFTRTIESAGIQEWELEEDLDLVAAYLAVQQIRFGDRMSVAYVIERGAFAARIPRLLLQPLVENAVRHGLAQRTEPTSIRIEARRVANKLVLRITNDAATTEMSALGGGLTFASALVNAAGGRVVIDRNLGSFAVMCSLPWRVL